MTVRTVGYIPGKGNPAVPLPSPEKKDGKKDGADKKARKEG